VQFIASLGKHVELITSFGNGTPYEAATDTNGQFALARRILARYFGVPVFSRIQPSLREALTVVHDAEQRGGTETATVTIVLGVDEVQRVLLALKLEKDETKEQHDSRRCARLREVIDAISGVLLDPVKGVLFLPMLAGTAHEDITNTIIRSSGHPIEPM
jgi:hypothetical protein